MDATNIQINGVEYTRTDTIETPLRGNRAVVVVDRGWIFAGDVTDEGGRIRLARAVWVFRWERIGFDGVLSDPHADGVEIRKLEHAVDLPAGAEVFRIPVAADWGLL